MKRLFWIALGLGAGATGTFMASRWTKRQAAQVSPAHLASEARSGVIDITKLLAEVLAEGRQAMAERERELSGQTLDVPASELRP